MLAAQSLPLRRMFEGAFKEGNERVIALGDVEPSSFTLLLDFMYDRAVKMDAENVEALLELSARFGVSRLRRHCCGFLARSATPSNACSLLAMADRYDCFRLRRDLLSYVVEVRVRSSPSPCFSCAPGSGVVCPARHLGSAKMNNSAPFPVCPTLQRFLSTCREDGAHSFCQLPLTLAVEVLRDDGLDSGSDGEVNVFWAAVSWLEADASRRPDADQVNQEERELPRW